MNFVNKVLKQNVSLSNSFTTVRLTINLCRSSSGGNAQPKADADEHEEFRVFNLIPKREQQKRRKAFKHDVPPPRSQQMPVDQDWGAVWPGPRSFHPATVPLPVRQGYTPKGTPAPNKYANAELMKIPNFLHLTPPVIKKQCEAIKAFCTEWPKGLDTDTDIEEHFPINVVTSDYCHALPTIRNPLSRIVTFQFKLSILELDKHARDKFRRLVGERYNPNTDILTIVTDRCPLRQQNYDYAQYLLTALFHESWVTEPWESMKSEADMEYYDWSRNASRKSSEAIVNWGLAEGGKEVPHEYRKAVERYINEGENEQNIESYKLQVLKMLELPIRNNSNLT